MSLERDDDPPPSTAVWDLFRRDEPDPRAIQAAYLRFAGRRPERLSAFRVGRWLAVGFVCGLGVAFGASGVSRRALREGSRPAVTSAPPPHAQGQEHHAGAPRALPPIGAAAPAPPPSSSSPRLGASTGRTALTEAETTDPQWQRAAAALRVHDYASAEQALREVEIGGAPGDRDAASLALAQVLLSRGRAVEARARLERLQTRASSALVRSKAQALLEATFSSDGRSSAAPPVPQ